MNPVDIGQTPMDKREVVINWNQGRTTMNRLLRLLRTLHSWLGAIVMPWVIVIGATGFYLNHYDPIMALFGYKEFSEAGFDRMLPAQPVTPGTARSLSAVVWPGASVQRTEEVQYHGRPSFQAVSSKGRLIVSRTTGHYYAKTPYSRRTFSPSGELLHTKYYWGPALKELHESGWLGGGLGTWLADIVAVAMMFFGMSGFTLWLAPKVRRLRGKRR